VGIQWLVLRACTAAATAGAEHGGKVPGSCSLCPALVSDFFHTFTCSLSPRLPLNSSRVLIPETCYHHPSLPHSEMQEGTQGGHPWQWSSSPVWSVVHWECDRQPLRQPQWFHLCAFAYPLPLGVDWI
jgi:hypothetical protein